MSEFSSLSSDLRDQISTIMRQSYKSFDASRLESISAETQTKSDGPSTRSICEGLCTVAYTAAKSECEKIEDPTGKAVCLVAAKALYDECIDECNS